MARVRVGRLAAWGAGSTVLAAWTVLSAFRQRSNFYAAAVYLSKSNACMMILWNQALFHTVLLGKALQAIFFGELRLIETERLQERAWFAVTETLLALTIFRQDFDSSFVVLFVSLLFLKVFHWLAADRVEAMEQAAQVSRLAHARMAGILSLLWLADVVLILYAFDSIMIDGPTVMIMFASEYMILLAQVWSTTMKYGINCVDLRRQEPWEEKSIYIFYVDLATDFFKLCTYLLFFGLILTFHSLPLNILRDVYITLRSFLLKVRDLRRFRQATRNMDALYPNATREEMDAMADKTCIICREDMEFRLAPGEAAPAPDPALAAEAAAQPPPQVEEPQQVVEAPRTGPNDTPKKLPCGHVFHFHCLRSWLERQQSCPTCRRPVLPQEQPAEQPRPAGVAPPGINNGAPVGGAAALNPEDAAIRQAHINLARNLGREAFGTIFPGIPFPPEAEDPAARLPAPPTPAQAAAQAAAGMPGDVPPAQPSAQPSSSAPAAGLPSPLAGAASSPSHAAAPSAPSDNPLARFTLPQLSVPSTGEAGLYHRPPSFAYPTSPSGSGPSAGYANIAHGAYPQFGGPLHPPPPARREGEAAMPRLGAQMNVEERIEQVRRRWEGMRAAQGGAAGATEQAAPQGEATAGGRAEEASAQEGSAEAAARLDKGKGKAVEPDEAAACAGEAGEAEDETLSPREAALRAAERRAGKLAQIHGEVTTARAPIGTSSSLATASDPTASPPPVAPSSTAAQSASQSAPPAQPAAPLPMPRLIPLFDPSQPSPASLSQSYPSLFPSRPLVPAAPSPAQLSELDQLARRGVEERLRLLVGFQDRIEGLVGEMQEALRAAPLDAKTGRGLGDVEGSAQNGVDGQREGHGEGEAASTM
ncbi:hypothetical protein Rhopal_003588-T1 [Rhodotorula paludigena]|uniref:RING-type E3 ubiquitin transferase n=1 Tax=Rhodotorula paludigena TaxID=86838 RepID=A0AAV5GDY6_9BASI|nr:hypothetical protein Rhopal_003588-T1 [Rhodotorula paludigena]